MEKEIKDMTNMELVEGFKSCVATKTRHICTYDGNRFWEELNEHERRAESFKQEILARFAKLETNFEKAS